MSKYYTYYNVYYGKKQLGEILTVPSVGNPFYIKGKFIGIVQERRLANYKDINVLVKGTGNERCYFCECKTVH